MISSPTDNPLKANKPFGAFADPIRLITRLPAASLPTINNESKSCAWPAACITRSMPIVTYGPEGGTEGAFAPFAPFTPLASFKAAGATSVTANTGFVILIMSGRPGTFSSGSATFKARSFKRSAAAAVLLNVERLIVPTIGITVSVTPPDAIKEPIPCEPLRSRSARMLKPSFSVYPDFVASCFAASARTFFMLAAIFAGTAGSSGFSPEPFGGTTTSVSPSTPTPSSTVPADPGTRSEKTSLSSVTAITALSNLPG